MFVVQNLNITFCTELSGNPGIQCMYMLSNKKAHLIWYVLAQAWKIFSFALRFWVRRCIWDHKAFILPLMVFCTLHLRLFFIRVEKWGELGLYCEMWELLYCSNYMSDFSLEKNHKNDTQPILRANYNWNNIVVVYGADDPAWNDGSWFSSCRKGSQWLGQARWPPL